MANTKGEKELRTSYEYPDPDVLNLIPEEGSIVARRKKVGL